MISNEWLAITKKYDRPVRGLSADAVYFRKMQKPDMPKKIKYVIHVGNNICELLGLLENPYVETFSNKSNPNLFMLKSGTQGNANAYKLTRPGNVTNKTGKTHCFGLSLDEKLAAFLKVLPPNRTLLLDFDLTQEGFLILNFENLRKEHEAN